MRDNYNVYGKLAKGAAVGIFLGVMLGIMIPTITNFKGITTSIKNAIDSRNEIAIGIGKDYGIGIGNESESYEEMGADLIETNSTGVTAISDSVLRFHIRANSNSDEDLALKIMVRDEVLSYLSEELENEGIDEAKLTRDEMITFVEDRMVTIKQIAEEVLATYGYDYPVKVSIADEFFPMRQYGDMTMPAGTYKALRVDIGEAKGENFWCLIYPTMCVTVDSNAFVSKEGEDKVKKQLDDEDFDRLFVTRDLKKGDVRVGFKFLELF